MLLLLLPLDADDQNIRKKARKHLQEGRAHRTRECTTVPKEMGIRELDRGAYE